MSEEDNRRRFEQFKAENTQWKTRVNEFVQESSRTLVDECLTGNIDAVSNLLSIPGIDVNLIHKNETALTAAVDQGHEDVVEMLLIVEDIDINKQNIHGNTPLYLATLKGYIRIVEILLRKSDTLQDTLNTKNNGKTALSAAVETNNLDMVRTFLDIPEFDRTCINVQNSDGTTALFIAVKENYLHIVQLLLKFPGINLDIRNAEGRTPLQLAEALGYTEVKQAILTIPRYISFIESAKNGEELPIMEDIDVNYTNLYGRTAFIEAIINNKRRVIQKLYDYDSTDINKTETPYGNTPLMYAVIKGSKKIVGLLLYEEVRIDISKTNIFGFNALMEASLQGYDDIVELLLPHIDVNIQNTNQMTALMIAAQFGHKDIVERFLTVKDINILKQTNFGNTALMYAAMEGHSEIVKLLLEHDKSNLNTQTRNGDTALFYAVSKGKLNVVKQLLQIPDIEVNIQTTLGMTSLMQACKNGYDDIVKELLTIRTIDVNKITNTGITALMWSVLPELAKDRSEELKLKYNNIVTYLLKHRSIDINIKNADNKTAYQIAKTKGHSFIATLLKNFKTPEEELQLINNTLDNIKEQIKAIELKPSTSKDLKTLKKLKEKEVTLQTQLNNLIVSLTRNHEEDNGIPPLTNGGSRYNTTYKQRSKRQRV